MEYAHLINENRNLSGVFCKAKVRRFDPVVIMINSGLLHHVGPYRLHTVLARQLANIGMNNLRFDLTDLGDSQPGGTRLSKIEQANTDIQEAMAFLEKHYEARSFIVFGLCSGADDAFEISKIDKRVAGTVLIDGHGFRTPKFHVRHVVLHFGRRIISRQKWITLANRLKSRFSRIKGDSFSDTRSEALQEGLGLELSRDEVAADIETMTKRGCKLRFIYTGGVSDYYNYHGQFEDCFPETRKNPDVSAIWYSDSDHLFMKRTHREAMISDLVQWFEENYA